MRTLAMAVALGASLAVLQGTAFAQTVVNPPVFDGPGLQAGVDEASNIQGPIQDTFRAVVLRMLRVVLDFLALASVIVIVAAGIFLIGGFGSEDSAGKAKTIIKYVIIGLLVIFFARASVGFLTRGFLR